MAKISTTAVGICNGTRCVFYEIGIIHSNTIYKNWKLLQSLPSGAVCVHS